MDNDTNHFKLGDQLLFFFLSYITLFYNKEFSASKLSDIHNLLTIMNKIHLLLDNFNIK